MFMASGVLLFVWVVYGLGLITLVLLIMFLIKANKALSIWIRKNED